MNADLRKFMDSLKRKVDICDCKTLFLALSEGLEATACIGSNAYWNHDTYVIKVEDNIWNDFVVMVRYKGISRIFRESECQRFHKQSAYIHAYQMATSG